MTPVVVVVEPLDVAAAARTPGLVGKGPGGRFVAPSGAKARTNGPASSADAAPADVAGRSSPDPGFDDSAPSRGPIHETTLARRRAPSRTWTPIDAADGLGRRPGRAGGGHSAPDARHRQARPRTHSIRRFDARG